MANKKERIHALIQKNLSDIIIFNMKNPLMRLASVNSIDLTNDYSYCKVYISHLKQESIDEVVEALNKSKGFIRSELARKMDIYKVPELTFVRDETFDNGERIESIIKELKSKK